MSADHEDEDDEIVAALAQVPRERTAPAALETRTVDALRARGLLRSTRPTWRPRAASAAAAIVIFATGWLLGSRAIAPAGNTPRYMLLLYAGKASDTPGDASVEEYRDWARRLRSTGLHISGERLDETPAAVFGGGDSEPAVDRLRGYFVFDAADDSDAMEIAKRHPHVRRGGLVILHRIRPT